MYRNRCIYTCIYIYIYIERDYNIYEHTCIFTDTIINVINISIHVNMACCRLHDATSTLSWVSARAQVKC